MTMERKEYNSFWRMNDVIMKLLFWKLLNTIKPKIIKYVSLETDSFTLNLVVISAAMADVEKCRENT